MFGLGLDSAGPGFGAATSGRLDASDAQFVDAIHTCAPFIGLMSAHGHADFYVNGGTYQPGCSSRDNGKAERTKAGLTFQTYCQTVKLITRCEVIHIKIKNIKRINIYWFKNLRTRFKYMFDIKMCL